MHADGCHTGLAACRNATSADLHSPHTSVTHLQHAARSQAPGLFVEVFDGQYLPIPDTGVVPVKRALSAGLDYAPEPGSGGFSGALFRLAGQLTQFSMRFTGATLVPHAATEIVRSP